MGYFDEYNPAHVRCPKCGRILDGLTLDYMSKWLCSDCVDDKKDVLHCERGSKVVAVNLDAGFDADKEDAHTFLTDGGIYEVESIYIGSWLSHIVLKEFPGQLFNTAHFERYA